MTSRIREDYIEERLAYLRSRLQTNEMTSADLAELRSLAIHIRPDDRDLIDAAVRSAFTNEESNDQQNS